MITHAAASILASTLLAAPPASALPRQSVDGLAPSRTFDTDGHVEMNGMSVSATGRVGGDLEMNGANIKGDVEVGGALFLHGASIDFEGRVVGASSVNGANIDLVGDFLGPVEINGAWISLGGRFTDEVVLRAARAELAGGFSQPVTVHGEDNSGPFGRRGSRIEIDGELASGGAICAHEVTFGSQARLGDLLVIRADAEPELPDGVDPARVRFTDRDGRSCD